MLALAGLLMLLAACASQSLSGAPMADANRRYEAGQFAEAATAYQALVDAGGNDGRLYYNLGNAYFKAGDLGRAILNYRRAQRLLPRDADIETNLRLARAQAVDRLGSEKEGALIGFIRRSLVASNTLDEAAGLALGVWVILCGFMIAALRWPSARTRLIYGILAATLLLALSLLSVGLRVIEEQGSPPAVIVSKEVAIHSGPGADYLTEFTLHAGAEVRVIEPRRDWVRISLPGGLQGWAPAEAVKEVAKRKT